LPFRRATISPLLGSAGETRLKHFWEKNVVLLMNVLVKIDLQPLETFHECSIRATRVLGRGVVAAQLARTLERSPGLLMLRYQRANGKGLALRVYVPELTNQRKKDGLFLLHVRLELVSQCVVHGYAGKNGVASQLFYNGMRNTEGKLS
jgi:hypothetical protein